MDSELEWHTAVRVAQDGTAYYRPTATIYGLDTNRRYSVRLRARNHIGWSDWSLASLFTTSTCGNVPLRWIHSDGSSHNIGHDFCENQNRNHNAEVKLPNTAGHENSAAPFGANPYMYGPEDDRREAQYESWLYPTTAGTPPPPLTPPPTPPAPGPAQWIGGLDSFFAAAGSPAN